MKSQLIFYLDDDTDDLEIFSIAAKKLNHRVQTFHEGEQLIQALRFQEQKPDIIFLDVHMPIVNGEEILQTIKRLEGFKNVPIVMISGAYPKKLVRYLNEIGVNFLMKRPALHELENALDDVIRKASENLRATG